jgi:hypothetical protein
MTWDRAAAQFVDRQVPERVTPRCSGDVGGYVRAWDVSGAQTVKWSTTIRGLTRERDDHGLSLLKSSNGALVERVELGGSGRRGRAPEPHVPEAGIVQLRWKTIRPWCVGSKGSAKRERPTRTRCDNVVPSRRRGRPRAVRPPTRSTFRAS